jgi:hypothetical protein
MSADLNLLFCLRILRHRERIIPFRFTSLSVERNRFAVGRTGEPERLDAEPIGQTPGEVRMPNKNRAWQSKGEHLLTICKRR